MKGDFSRITFDPDKNYVETLMQQGRVQLDADWNEQQSMHRHLRQKAVAEIIGRHGAPKTGGGFAIGLTANASDLTISTGQFYVDGIGLENNSAQLVTLSAQPFLPLKQGLLAGFERPKQSGRYLVYLEVWERHVTADIDPEILEEALGGVDTTTRKQVVWQVKLTKQAVPASAVCDDFAANWSPPESLTNGTMKADTVTVSSSTTPCVIPPAAGYKGLENQLYRVEIHRGGNSQSGAKPATFKWSRDNGSVTTTVTISGQTLIARDLGRDEISLGFKENQWIEITDERMELTNQRGELIQIESIDKNTREIKIKAATPVPQIDATKPVIIRRWDNTGNQADKNGIRLSNTPAVLESGVEIEFSSGVYRSGDYWLIPARTSINSSTGSIEWKRDPGTGQSMLVSPHGIDRHYSPLALVQYDLPNDSFALVPNADCRPLFPSLTDIAASDVSFDSSHCESSNMLMNVDTVQDAIDSLCTQMQGCCTYHITPQTDIKKIAEKINALGKVHVKICFQLGDYQIDQPLIIGTEKNPKGHIVITGFGKGTQLVAENLESCLRFENCESVSVYDLTAKANHVANTKKHEHLNGVLTFIDCGEVNVNDCSISCGSGPVRGATCISVIQQKSGGSLAKQVRIERNSLKVGMEQVGILVLNASRAWIQDNNIDVVKSAASLTLSKLLKNKVYRASARSLLVSHAQYNGKKPADMTNIETVKYGREKKVYFKTDPGLIGQWTKLVGSTGSMPSTDLLMKLKLKQVADDVLLEKINLNSFPAFKQWYSSLSSKTRAVASQGIVISGSVNNGNIWVKNNAIVGVLQGIKVGYSKRESRKGSNVRATGINIQGNRVQMHIPPVATRHIEGIFIGSYSNEAIIESNTVSGAFIASSSTAAHNEGIKVYGMLGNMLVIRHNTVFSIASAIRVVPLNGSHHAVHRWLVADNLVSGSANSVDLSADRSIDHIGNHPTGMSYTDLDNRLKALERN
ncbi:MAG: DUF6519 domain-containing protein [Gammaproteobacteria bacterium]|nr:DUF6519 domain-containing protein [Gammaproteobacteria bacterium]